MRVGLAAVAALCVCAPANAFTMTASFSAIATGGTLSTFFLAPTPYPPTQPLAGNLFDITANAKSQLIPGETSREWIPGDFAASSSTVRPVAAGFVFGRSDPFFSLNGGKVTLTDTTFTYSYVGDVLGDNNRGTLTLTADRVGGSLANWRGIISGHVELLGQTGERPYDYDYRDMTFVLQSGRIAITGVAGIPEPASWAMMIGGFGLAGTAARRKRPVIHA